MKITKKILSAAVASILCIGTQTAALAADYINPWVYDASPNEKTSFAGGQILQGGIQRLGDYVSDPQDRDSNVMINSNKGLAMAIINENGNRYYKLYQTSEGTLGSGNITLGYNSGYGFNSANLRGGNIYGKATFELRFKAEKNKYYDSYTRSTVSGSKTAFALPIRIYNSNNPTMSDNTAAYFRMYHYVDWDSQEDNKNRYGIGIGQSNNSFSGNDGSMLTMGKWYTLKMDIDVPNNTVEYSIFSENGDSVKSVKKTLNKQSTFVAPVISLDNFTVYGLDIYLDDLKITRETFIIKDIETNENDTSVTASVKIANDVWGTTSKPAYTAAPKLIVATYDSKGTLVSAGMSADAAVEAKSDATAQPKYVTLSAAADKPASGEFTTKAFLWSDMNDMTPYTQIK